LAVLWGVATPATRGPRARVGLGELAEAAVGCADRDGLASVSLAAVGAELGLTTTALYRYIDAKDTLVELMIDSGVGPAPELPADDWRTRTHAWCRALCERYRLHPWLADVPIGGMPRYPNRVAWIDQVLVELDRGPVTDPMRAALLLDAIARTFALLDRRQADTEPPPAWILRAVTERHPRLGQELNRDWTDLDQELSHSIDIVLLASNR
jgi:AcrR family transcriptional regulator